MQYSQEFAIQYLLSNLSIPVCVCPTEQIDEGLAGKQRQYEGWIHNLSKELNHYKAANVELNNRLRELCGSVSLQPRDPAKGNIHSDVFTL